MKLQESTEPMTKNGDMVQHDREIADSLRLSGRKIPADLGAKVETAIKSMLLKKRDTDIERRIQRAKRNGGSSSAVDAPANQETLNENLLLHKSVMNAEVQFPRAAPANGGVWILRGTMAPPFDIAFATPQAFFGGPWGNPVTSGSASPNGQISASVATGISDGLNAGREIAVVGFHFYPPGPGTLRIWASPSYSFAWKINSTNNEDIFDIGSISLSIGNLNADGEFDPVAEDFQNVYFKTGTGSNQESDVQKSLAISLDVKPGMVNSCFVYLDVAAMAPWPWSLAWSMMSATVPSIGYEFVEKFSAS